MKRYQADTRMLPAWTLAIGLATKQSSQPVSADDYYDGYNLNAFDAIIKHLTS